MKAGAAAVLALCALLANLPAQADDALVDRWYAALAAVDSDSLSALLANNAKISLNDLGVEQTKSEFLGSMDEWKEAMTGAAIRHRIESTNGEVASVLVCYDFARNDVLMRETFTVREALITENTQTRLADDCNGY